MFAQHDIPSQGRRLAIVGAGPAGCYAAKEALQAQAFETIDVFDDLPVPYGLLRYGVAPDHPRTKRVARVLESGLGDPRVRFHGNVRIGEAVKLENLRRAYDAVVLATGASLDRTLGLRGETATGVLGSTEFVRWYSGHPDSKSVDLANVTDAVVVGGGNVALDIVRLICVDPHELARTDMPTEVLDQFARSRVERVSLLVRGRPDQTRFSYAELAELAELAERGDIEIVVDPSELDGLADPDDSQGRGVLELLRQWTVRPSHPARRTLRISFQTQLNEISGSPAVEEVTTISTNTIDPTRTVHPAQLVVTAIGQVVGEVCGPPCNVNSGRISNDGSRVRDELDRPVPGLFVVGWAKRGASGALGTNKKCATDTIRCVVQDLPQLSLPRPNAIHAIETQLRTLEAVNWRGWKRIEGFEAGLAAIRGNGSEAVKVHNRQHLLAISIPAQKP